MPNANKLTIIEEDASFSPNNPTTGIICFQGKTKRGPVGKPQMLITSWPMFKKVYGGYLPSSSDFPLLSEHAFIRGAKLRVNRVGHYSDIADASTLTVVTAKNPSVQRLTFSAAFVASNSIALSVNGVAITPVVYASTSDATLAALATTIAAMAGVQFARVVSVAAGTANDRTIIVGYTSTTPTGITSISVTGGASQATGTATSLGTYIPIADGTSAMIKANSKYEGADYNNIIVSITTPSNGDSTKYFNLHIYHATDTTLDELYENLTVTGNPAIADSTYLNDVNANSELVEFTYANLSSTVGQVMPAFGTYQLVEGSDGGSITATDYAGDSAAKTGLYRFNAVTDSSVLMIPEMDDDTLHQAASAYVAARKDMMYIGYLNISSNNPNTWVTERNSMAADSRFVQIVAGNIEVNDPATSTKRYVSPMGEVAGAIASTHTSIGAWRAYTNATNGQFKSAIGVQVNFGSPADYADLNLLANNQICPVISKDGKIFLSGNFTSQKANSKLAYASISFLSIYLKKLLTPILQKFVDDEVPLDLTTFKDIYNSVKPAIEALTSDTARAIYPGEGQGWKWDGDQNVANISQVVINNTTDLDNGKYKAKLYYKPINSLREFELVMTLTKTSISFE